MSDEQQKALKALNDKMASATDGWLGYWDAFSDFDTWQFWVNLFLFFAPLVVLFLVLDRSKAFRIGFFGLAIHMISVYVDTFGTTHGFWEYPYKWFPFLTVSLGLDASLIPVSYMLLYQWTLSRNKNYYVWMIGLALLFSFGFKPLLSALDLFQLYRGTNYFHLLLLYTGGGLIAKWITEGFERFQDRASRTSRA